MSRESWPWVGFDGWAKHAATDVAHRRAGGRRRYNAARQRERELRRDRLSALAVETWPRFMTDRGWQAWAARQLGVSRATLCRDVDAILAEQFGRRGTFCITHRLLRALMPTPAETSILDRHGTS